MSIRSAKRVILPRFVCGQNFQTNKVSPALLGCKILVFIPRVVILYYDTSIILLSPHLVNNSNELHSHLYIKIKLRNYLDIQENFRKATVEGTAIQNLVAALVILRGSDND